MKKTSNILILILIYLASFLIFPLSGPAHATQNPAAGLKWGLFRNADAPDKANIVAVLFVTPPKGWHTYAPSADPTGQTTRIKAVPAPGDGQPLPVLFTKGHPLTDQTDPSIVYSIYADETPFFLPLPGKLSAAGKITAEVSLLLCNDKACLPFNTHSEFDLAGALSGRDPASLPALSDQPWSGRWREAAPPETLSGAAASGGSAVAAASGPETPSAPAYDFQPRSFTPGLEVHGLLKAVLLAFLAGLVLNLMPCVLPVISLKMVSFFPRDGSLTTDDNCRPVRIHSIFFALGILAYFLILALIVSLAGLAWGQIFQNPLTVVILAVVVFALSLSLFDIYTLPVIDLKFGASAPGAGHPRSQAFFTGVLVTLLATPCSGPFLGGVLAWALLQPARIIAAVFLAIGLGMAAPYLTFAVFPCMARLFPRPGRWNNYLEKGMGFLLGATCLYLIYLLPSSYLFPTLVLLWATSVAAWIWGQWTSLSDSTARRWTVRLGAVAFLAVLSWFALGLRHETTPWPAFAEPAFSRQAGQELLLVDFTADWCPTCKVLESTVLTPDNLASWKKKYGISLMRVDLSRDNPGGLALLRALHSQSIPVLAVFPKGADSRKPIVLRDVVTAGQVENALAEAAKTR